MSRFGGTVSFDIGKEIDKLQSEQRKARDAADSLTAKTIAENRDFTPEERKAFDEAKGEMVTLGKRVDTLKSYAEERAKTDERGQPRTPVGDPDPKKAAGRTASGDDDLDDEQRSLREREREHRKVFRNWMRHGMNDLRPEERSIMQSRLAPADEGESRALSAVTGSAGGYTVPQEFNSQIVVAMKDFSGVMKSKASTIPSSSGADMPWPTVNDTSQAGELLGENTAAAGQDVAFGTVTLKGYVFSSKIVLVPIQLLQDTGVDIEAVLARLLGERLGRVLNTYFTTGTGTSQPQGVVTFSTLGKTAAAAAAITYGETIDLQHSVDPAYRGQGNCEYMFHDTTFAALRKLLDSSGRPIWSPQALAGAAAGAPATLNGSPYVINQNMAVPGTGNKSMLFGDFTNYKIRQIKSMTLLRLVERYAEYLQVGFLAHCRFDGRGVNAGTNPITHLIHP